MHMDVLDRLCECLQIRQSDRWVFTHMDRFLHHLIWFSGQLDAAFAFPPSVLINMSWPLLSKQQPSPSVALVLFRIRLPGLKVSNQMSLPPPFPIPRLASLCTTIVFSPGLNLPWWDPGHHLPLAGHWGTQTKTLGMNRSWTKPLTGLGLITQPPLVICAAHLHNQQLFCVITQRIQRKSRAQFNFRKVLLLSLYWILSSKE